MQQNLVQQLKTEVRLNVEHLMRACDMAGVGSSGSGLVIRRIRKTNGQSTDRLVGVMCSRIDKRGIDPAAQRHGRRNVGDQVSSHGNIDERLGTFDVFFERERVLSSEVEPKDRNFLYP